eukprot:2576676-Pleurochrysis_carterae.AAC.1
MNYAHSNKSQKLAGGGLRSASGRHNSRMHLKQQGCFKHIPSNALGHATKSLTMMIRLAGGRVAVGAWVRRLDRYVLGVRRLSKRSVH